MTKPNNNILWVCLILIVSIIFGTIYTASQQILRQDANDPQIQQAEDAAANLSNGGIANYSTSGAVKMNNSLAPFTNVYDKSGNVLTGNGYLNNQLSDPPFGSLQASNNVPYNAVTWQPTDNLRFATVIISTPNFYIVSGRSLFEVEKREALILHITFAGWLASIVVIIFCYIYMRINHRKHKKRTKNNQIPQVFS